MEYKKYIRLRILPDTGDVVEEKLDNREAPFAIARYTHKLMFLRLFSKHNDILNFLDEIQSSVLNQNI